MKASSSSFEMALNLFSYFELKIKKALEVSDAVSQKVKISQTPGTPQVIEGKAQGDLMYKYLNGQCKGTESCLFQ